MYFYLLKVKVEVSNPNPDSNGEKSGKNIHFIKIKVKEISDDKSRLKNNHVLVNFSKT